MPVTVRSFAKINLGLRIGALRPDGFHELRTVYQTIALHDIVRVDVLPGAGIEIRCADPRVPKDESNTCYGVIEQAMRALAVKGKVVIEIEKRLPVQGGLGGASANAVAALLALERAFRQQLPASEKLRIAAAVGSDLPLFLLGGAVLGVGRGEEVYPLPDLPGIPCVVATPEIAVSTPRAFADWDLRADERSAGTGRKRDPAKLTPLSHSDRISEFGRTVSAWLSGFSRRAVPMGRPLSGVPARGRGRAESPLLDLVRTGIENDFEQVVFPQYPELHEVKCRLLSAGAGYASLSGSGSAVYGLFHARSVAARAAAALAKTGVGAQATLTLSRADYWKRMFR